jgi:Tol biopolymer transport system component
VRTLVAVLLLSGCFGLPGGGTGGGSGGGGADSGAGGGSAVDFREGFTFVAADRNVGIVDLRNLALTGTLTSSANTHAPTLSKDGKLVAFVQNSGLDAALSVVSTGGGAVTVLLTASASGNNFRAPVFSPDGSRLAFTYDDASAASNLGLINVDGTNLERLAGGNGSSYGAPTFSADGTVVLAAAGPSRTQLMRLVQLSVATGAESTVLDSFGSEASVLANRLTLAADQNRVLFDATISTGATRIFGANLSTRVVAKLVEQGGSDSFPCWVDANTFAFAGTASGTSTLYSLTTGATALNAVEVGVTEPWFGP